MNTKEITFEEAYSYIKHLNKIFNITELAERMEISRNTLSAVMNGTLNKDKNPTTMPDSYEQPIIDFVKSIQFDEVKEKMPIVTPPVTKFKRDRKTSRRKKPTGESVEKQ